MTRFGTEVRGYLQEYIKDSENPDMAMYAKGFFDQDVHVEVMGMGPYPAHRRTPTRARSEVRSHLKSMLSMSL